MKSFFRIKMTAALVLLLSSLHFSNLYAQEKDTVLLWSDIEEMMSEVDSILMSISAGDLDLIKNIRQSFHNSFENDERFLQILGESRLDVEAFEILEIVKDDDYKKYYISNASVDAEDNYKFTQNLLFEINDKSWVASRILMSYYTGLKPVDIEGSTSLNAQKVYITNTLIAWMLAHEIAHQYLNHNQSQNPCCEPNTLEISRDCEIEADDVSFEILDKSGYSLVKLCAFFDLMERIENIKRMVDQYSGEETRSHPSWRSRLFNLRYYLTYQTATEPEFYVYSTFMPSEDLKKPIAMTFVLQNDERNHIGLAVTDDIPELVAYDLSEEPAINIFQRDQSYIYKFSIVDKNSIETYMNFSDSDPVSPVNSSFLVFRDDFLLSASVMPASKEYEKIYNSYFNYDRHNLYKKTISEFISNDEQIDYGTGVLEESYMRTSALFFQYSKGQISLTEYLTKMEEYNADLMQRLGAILNTTQIEQLLSTMLSNLF